MSAPAALDPARLPRPVLEVLRRLAGAGFRSWVVGGVVRDHLLGRPHEGDVDLATPARPEDVQRLFRRVLPTGVEHGTVTVVQHGLAIEVTTFRGEGAYVDGRRPSSVTFLADVEGDLARRDFTVNAMAWDPLDGGFADPFGGRDDLAHRVLRAVGTPGERFGEDGLRPLRAARFAAQLGFALHPATEAAIHAALPVTARVAQERISVELGKLLVAPHAGAALLLVERTGLLGVMLPEVAALGHDLRHHAFRATVAAHPELTTRLTALLHALAAERPSEEAALAAERALLRLRFANRVAAEARALVAVHGCLEGPAGGAPVAADVGLRRWAARLGGARVAPLLALWESDAEALHPPERAREEEARRQAFERALRRALASDPPLAVGDLALTGADVMRLAALPPGREVGEALRHLLDRVLEEPALNAAEALAFELRRWRAGRG